MLRVNINHSTACTPRESVVSTGATPDITLITASRRAYHTPDITLITAARRAHHTPARHQSAPRMMTMPMTLTKTTKLMPNSSSNSNCGSLQFYSDSDDGPATGEDADCDGATDQDGGDDADNTSAKAFTTSTTSMT